MASAVSPTAINGAMLIAMQQLMSRGGSFTNADVAFETLVSAAHEELVKHIPVSWDELARVLDDTSSSEHASSEAMMTFLKDAPAEYGEATSLKVCEKLIRTLRHRLFIHMLASLGPQMTRVREGPVVVERAYVPPLIMNIFTHILQQYSVRIDFQSSLPPLPLLDLENACQKSFDDMVQLFVVEATQLNNLCGQ